MRNPAIGLHGTGGRPSDNGPAFKSARFGLFIASRPEITHVRIRHRAPQTNGVIERFFGSAKYEHLYRLGIADGHVLHEETQACWRIYNEIRPHEHLDFGTALEAYLAPLGSHLSGAKSVQAS